MVFTGFHIDREFVLFAFVVTSLSDSPSLSYCEAAVAAELPPLLSGVAGIFDGKFVEILDYL